MSFSYMAMWCRQMFSSSPVTLIRRVSDKRRTMRSSFWRTSSLTNTGRRLTILGTWRKVARYSSSDNLRCLLLTRRAVAGGVSVVEDNAGACDGLASSLTEWKRESSPCTSLVISADGLFPSFGATEELCPVCSFCSLLPKAIGDSEMNDLSSASVKFPMSFFAILLCFLVTTMVRVCTADRLSCAKVVCAVGTAKHLD